MAEVVAVVHAFQFRKSLLFRFTPILCQQFYVRLKLCGEFLLCDAAQCLVVGQHGNVLQIVQCAEYAHLREFGNAGNEDKLQVIVECFQRSEEVGEADANALFHFVVTDAVQHEVIIFVDNHHDTPPRLAVSLGDDALEAGAAVGSSGRDAIFLFVLREGVVYLQVENLGGVDFVLAEVEMNDGIPIPLPIGGGDEELWLLYAFLGGESFKEFTPPLKNGLECGTQQ